jgi:hypothetical protein
MGNLECMQYSTRLTGFNKLKIMLEVARDNCKGLKLFYRLHKLLFDRGDSCLECFNRATKTVGLCQPVPVRYCTRGKRFFFIFVEHYKKV